MLVGNREVLIRGILSDHVAEMLLGMDWLETRGAIWDLKGVRYYMHGGVYLH